MFIEPFVNDLTTYMYMYSAIFICLSILKIEPSLLYPLPLNNEAREISLIKKLALWKVLQPNRVRMFHFIM